MYKEDLVEGKTYILQIRSKRKNAQWRDYMLFDTPGKAIEHFEKMLSRPIHYMLDRRDIRLIYREIQETLILPNV